jgi:hypothetical protein
MNCKHSPVEIEVLLFHYYSDEIHPNMESYAVGEAIERFRRNGIFTNQIRPHLTPRGKAFVKCILNTEYPMLKYVDSYNNIIEIDE